MTRHRTLGRVRFSIAAIALWSAGCALVDTPSEATDARRPTFAISDAVHGHGSPNFYLLPPMVPNPNAHGQFDGGKAPVVEVCRWSGTCDAVIARFTRTSGTGGGIIEITDQQYRVNWDTHQCLAGACTLDPSATYRIRFLLEGFELGYADVVIVSNGSQLKNLDTQQYIGLVDGRTLPIRFRIEQGLSVIPASGGTTELFDGAVVLAFNSGAFGSEATMVSATPEEVGSDGSDTSVLDGSLYEFGPSPTTFAAPVTLSLTYPAALPAGMHADRLAICRMEGTACVPVPGRQIDLATRTLTAPITTFSKYAVTEVPEVLYQMGTELRVTWAGGDDLLATDAKELNPWTAPNWTADGSRVVYEAAGGMFRIVNRDGTGQATLSTTWPGGRDYRFVTMAPTLDHVLLTQHNTGVTELDSIVITAADGTGFHYLPLTTYTPPVWAPDGQRFAFVDDDGLKTAALDGSGVTLVAPQARVYRLAWSADGKLLAFGGSAGGGPWGIWTVATNGQQLRLLTIDNGVIKGIWLSPNAGEVLYSVWGGIVDDGLGIVSTNGVTGVRRADVPPGSGLDGCGWADYASWAPAGDRWAYGCTGYILGLGAGETSGIWVLNLDGTGFQMLETHRQSSGVWGGGGTAAWRP